MKAASISRASFYQYFTGIEDAFWQSYREHADRLIGEARAATKGARQAEFALLDLLVGVARDAPAVAQLLMREGLAAGEKVLEERERLIAGFVEAIEGADRAASIDMPAGLLIGGIFRFLALRLDAREAIQGVERNIYEWAETFLAGAREPRWVDAVRPWSVRLRQGGGRTRPRKPLSGSRA